MKKVLLTLSLLPALVMGQKTIIHCGKLFDGQSKTIQSEKTIIVERNKIVAVQNGFIAPASGETLIDLSKKTVMPGLIDMHVHIESETSRDASLKRIQNGPADVAYEAQKHAKTTLMAGFTTVRDLGGSLVNISLRNAIEKGLVDGPRIFTAGKTIATTGGHGDPSNGIGVNLEIKNEEDAMNSVVDSPEAARKAVRQRYKDGSDLIKITATAGVLSIAKSGKAPQFTQDEVNAIIETANDYGMHVAAHAHGAEGMKRAIRAGVTTIEHGTLMDDEAMALFKQKGTFLVPTITAGRSAADSAKVKGYYHPLVTPKALEIGSKIQDNFAKAYKAGVKIAFGTDAGVFRHGVNALEFQFMAEGGMPVIEALTCATKVNAEILGMADQIGAIAAGRFADIVATDVNPVDDVKTLMNVTFVMKNGLIYKNK